MQNPLHARKIDLGIFREGMVPLYQQRAPRQQKQPNEIQRFVFVRSDFAHSTFAIVPFTPKLPKFLS